MRILIATDAFPPVCGGSGWSTYELARGLRARGHHILVAHVTVGARREPAEYDGFRPIGLASWAPPVPFARNYFGNERLYRRAGARLAALAREARADVVHGQHLRSGPATVLAGQRAGVPAVCTVRDYWPVCYWSDLIWSRSADSLCPACSAGMMTRCLRPHAGALWPIGLPAIPYMLGNLARKRHALAAAGAVVAVSTVIARDLRARSPELAACRIETIPNPVDVAGLRAQADRQPRPLDVPYALYVGKLAPNKGVMKLVDALARARLDWPLVVVGDGPDRPELERATRAAGQDVRFTGWLSRDEVLGWLRHAGLLVFPSHGPESLSRVLLEASALGVPIAALDTGGTRDIIVHEETGLVSDDAGRLGEDVARLRADETLRRRLGEAARRRIERTFEAGAVVARLEALYRDLMGVRAAPPASGEPRP